MAIDDDTLVAEIPALRLGIRHKLINAGLTTAGILRQKTDVQLRMYPGIGKTIIAHVRAHVGYKSVRVISPWNDAIDDVLAAIGDVTIPEQTPVWEVLSLLRARIAALKK